MTKKSPGKTGEIVVYDFKDRVRGWRHKDKGTSINCRERLEYKANGALEPEKCVRGS
ncbi:hypothetical protein [Prosthecochloris marina]|uniref:hypothetical protein n=1 Tax=Prosthecochloris marina TaxID=2017681 RepID=UPI0012948565|nr:hypothetical protein [Prosthecochloris marina]